LNIKLFNRIAEITRALKPKKATGRSFHASFAIKKGKIVCIGWNNYDKSHRHKKFGPYKNWRNLPGEYKVSLHAEVSLLIRLGEEDLSSYELAVVRIDNNGDVVNSKPCPNCMQLWRSVEPKKICYSVANERYEEMRKNNLN
jgi:deoxycytidylate deaminase